MGSSRSPVAFFSSRSFDDVYSNLALDEALLQSADDEEEREPRLTLRLWEQPTLAAVLGASCRRNEDAHVDRCLEDGIPIARRSSGGGTVLIGPGAFNFALIAPISLHPEFRAVDIAQRFVLQRVADRLNALGASVTVKGSGDLAIGDRKCSGSAQRRLRRTLLIHATILYDFPLPLIGRYLKPPRKRPAWRGDRSHDDFLINLPVPRERLASAVAEAWLPDDRPILDAEIPETLVERLLADRLADRNWIERF